MFRNSKFVTTLVLLLHIFGFCSGEKILRFYTGRNQTGEPIAFPAIKDQCQKIPPEWKPKILSVDYTNYRIELYEDDKCDKVLIMLQSNSGAGDYEHFKLAMEKRNDFSDTMPIDRVNFDFNLHEKIYDKVSSFKKWD